MKKNNVWTGTGSHQVEVHHHEGKLITPVTKMEIEMVKRELKEHDVDTAVERLFSLINQLIENQNAEICNVVDYPRDEVIQFNVKHDKPAAA